MALYRTIASSTQPDARGKTEFEILKETHRFLREGDEDTHTDQWEEKMAKKYYDSLFREYAVCDLKHYKSGNFALRWRTESEVISGAGETTCGNTRCALHPPRNIDERTPGLKTLELPFSYEERGEHKIALVKVVLCDKCCGKLMWKRRKEKEKETEKASEIEQQREPDASATGAERKEIKREDEAEVIPGQQPASSARRKKRHDRKDKQGESNRTERSRSRSPHPRSRDKKRRKQSP